MMYLAYTILFAIIAVVIYQYYTTKQDVKRTEAALRAVDVSQTNEDVLRLRAVKDIKFFLTSKFKKIEYTLVAHYVDNDFLEPPDWYVKLPGKVRSTPVWKPKDKDYKIGTCITDKILDLLNPLSIKYDLYNVGLPKNQKRILKIYIEHNQDNTKITLL